MYESGGTSTQAGIYYQNSIAALALGDLLDFDLMLPRERLVEVRLEAPEHVDDMVLRFADGHADFQTVKLSLRLGSAAWDKIWRDLAAQAADIGFGPADQLTIIVSERNSASNAVASLCAQAAGSVNAAELSLRLDRDREAVLTSVTAIVGGEVAAFELLRVTRLLYRPEDEVEATFSRNRLAGGPAFPALLPLLRDIAGGHARHRGLFQSAPLRRRLKQEYRVSLPDPQGWDLGTYRNIIRSLARIDIPGTAVSDTAERLFVWPRAQAFDAERQTDFEDEVELFGAEEVPALDLKAFPSDQFDKLVVVAGPGYGKSALLTAIAGQLADGPLVPVAVPLSALSAADSGIVDFLGAAIYQEMEVRPDWKLLAEHGLLVLLLDGLDEVPAASRPTLLRRLATFSARYPKAPWILTVRDAGVLNGVPEATLVELQTLSDADIENFAEAMQRYIGDIKPWTLARSLKLYPDLDRLARIPLFLMLLLATTDLNHPRPLTRADLIETYLSTLFTPGRYKLQGGTDADSAILRLIAETLAFERLERQQIGASEREVREVIERFEPKPARVETLLEKLRTNGILKPQGPVRLQFPYPIIQEYLAARHLVDHFPESLVRRIDDAVQRPWAQVIQFAIELHPDPEPIIVAMLARDDDAFATGLRLVGRCVANGATVGSALRLTIGERLVDFWVGAPSRSRERVGRLLADGFANLPSTKLERALLERHLLEQGGGDVLTRRADPELTLRVLDILLAEPSHHMGIYHSFKYALREAGDAALDKIIAAMDPDRTDAETIDDLSGLFWNFVPGSISQAKVLAVARDARLPRQARARAYKLVGGPIEDAAATLILEGFKDPDWDRNYAVADLIEHHQDPAEFFEALLREPAILAKRKRELAGYITRHVPDPSARAQVSARLIADSAIDPGVRATLRIIEARHGNRSAFVNLLDEIPTLPIEDVGNTISIFGFYPDAELSGQAIAGIRSRNLMPEEMVRISHAAHIGMRYLSMMDLGLGGTLRTAPYHPGTAGWINLLEDWWETNGLDEVVKLELATSASRLGSERMRAVLERSLLAVTNFDAAPWSSRDDHGNLVGGALRELRRRVPVFSPEFIDRILASDRYNIAMNGISALTAQGDRNALLRLIEVHANDGRSMLRDLAANAVELLAARLQLIVRKTGRLYRLD